MPRVIPISRALPVAPGNQALSASNPRGSRADRSGSSAGITPLRNHSVAVRTDLDAGRTLECVITHGDQDERFPAARSAVLPAYGQAHPAPARDPDPHRAREKAPDEPTARSNRLRRKEI